LLDDTAPVAVAVERILFQSNARTAISVGQASGLVLAAAARRGIAVAEYSPTETKLAVAGDGRADKVAMQSMVARVCHLTEPPSPPDVADALALAICHAWRDRGGVPVAAPTGGRRSGFERAVAAALARERGA
jgi:crossover junction endodeoxyribonuclease RuvC